MHRVHCHLRRSLLIQRLLPTQHLSTSSSPTSLHTFCPRLIQTFAISQQIRYRSSIATQQQLQDDTMEDQMNQMVGATTRERSNKEEGIVNKRKPITPGLRHRRAPSRAMLWKGGPFKPLTIGFRKKGGRNEHGHVTARHRGGGHKKRYRIIDWKRKATGPHEVLRLEYDPNRSAHIALLKRQECGTLSYILSPHGVKAGDILLSGHNIPIERGNRVQISECPSGTIVHALAYRKNDRAKIARSAGTYAQIITSGPEGYAQVKLSSGEIRYLPVEAHCTIGVVSNIEHHLRRLGSAGAARHLGRRPRVRATTMNPVDHPMGGGEGKSKTKVSTSPTGKVTKGVFTVAKHKNRMIIKPRVTKNKRKMQPALGPPGGRKNIARPEIH